MAAADVEINGQVKKYIEVYVGQYATGISARGVMRTLATCR
jgi:hypothetical protein